MTRLFKTTAIAALAITTALPAYSAAHLDVNSMTCEMYNELSGADRDKVAMMVVADISGSTDGTVAANDGTATATNATEGTTAEESPTGSTNTVADSDGTATATSTVPAGDDMSQYAEKIKLLNRTCSRNWDAMVTEAASGQGGSR
ncbi:HdeA/HdeB family chaperone [Sulfitobacter sp. F26169L]|uniref:HdeA/HdeB family chaperone n=1 Tax=Sulfitobacter sp. F26169L TaxID=2996015 RepID=UPI002260E84E|nr:HdeA/HdeB family chaperone [Sulfitobacter sp. F26169L]MCX7566566.1 HdeA/HdeB family chaperone [Sulfitobacter sp. F26169L]